MMSKTSSSPRKFAEKIALLCKKESEGNAAFAKILQEVKEETTRAVPSSSMTNALGNCVGRNAGFNGRQDGPSPYGSTQQFNHQYDMNTSSISCNTLPRSNYQQPQNYNHDQQHEQHFVGPQQYCATAVPNIKISVEDDECHQHYRDTGQQQQHQQRQQQVTELQQANMYSHMSAVDHLNGDQADIIGSHAHSLPNIYNSTSRPVAAFMSGNNNINMRHQRVHASNHQSYDANLNFCTDSNSTQSPSLTNQGESLTNFWDSQNSHHFTPHQATQPLDTSHHHQNQYHQPQQQHYAQSQATPQACPIIRACSSNALMSSWQDPESEALYTLKCINYLSKSASDDYGCYINSYSILGSYDGSTSSTNKSSQQHLIHSSQPIMISGSYSDSYININDEANFDLAGLDNSETATHQMPHSPEISLQYNQRYDNSYYPQSP